MAARAAYVPKGRRDYAGPGDIPEPTSTEFGKADVVKRLGQSMKKHALKKARGCCPKG